jgi:hypothetical protein
LLCSRPVPAPRRAPHDVCRPLRRPCALSAGLVCCVGSFWVPMASWRRSGATFRRLVLLLCLWLCLASIPATPASLRLGPGPQLTSPGVQSSAASCVEYSGQLVGTRGFPHLSLPGGATLGGNFYGVGGHISTLDICVLRGQDGTMGWNWSRGVTSQQCSEPELCKGPICYADFAFVRLGVGIDPFSSGKDVATTSAPAALPADVSTLDHLIVSQNVTWSWRDAAPGVNPPQTGRGESRRARFIYDFFLTTVPPNGSNVASTITDEITIALAANPRFPGSQPPGCWDNSSRFGSVTTGPVLRNAVWDGHHYYDYWYTDHHDAVPGTGTRFSNFRRVGATDAGSQPPAQVDILPFIAAVQKMWPGEQVGQWCAWNLFLSQCLRDVI